MQSFIVEGLDSGVIEQQLRESVGVASLFRLDGKNRQHTGNADSYLQTTLKLVLLN